MTTQQGGCCKVGRAIARFDLDERGGSESMNEQLVERWTGAGRASAQGYRPLTAWFNQRLLKSAYDEHGLESTGSRVERDYETLTGDDEIDADELRDLLESEGVDVGTLEGSFVSWSTMQRHLNDCLGATKERHHAETEWERNSVEYASDQLESKVDAAVSSLTSKGELVGGTDAETTIDVQLSCPECPLRVPFEEAIARGYVCPDHLGTPEKR